MINRKRIPLALDDRFGRGVAVRYTRGVYIISGACGRGDSSTKLDYSANDTRCNELKELGYLVTCSVLSHEPVVVMAGEVIAI